MDSRSPFTIPIDEINRTKIGEAQFSKPGNSTPLGKGSYGVVFKGTYTNPQTKKIEDVALKELSIFKQCKMGFVAKKDHVQNKIRACDYERNILLRLKQLNVPNCMELLGWHSGQFNFTFVLPLYKNGTLTDHIKSDALSFAQRYNIMLDITLGLEGMHKEEFIHTDIKPANIFLDENFRGVLGDFGSTTTKGDAIQYGITQVGTPFYFAPELLDGKNMSFATDIYALAIVFVITEKKVVDPFLLNDKEMFSTWIELEYEVIHKQRREEISKTCPVKLSSLVQTMWAQAPEDRPTASQVLESLKNLDNLDEPQPKLSALNCTFYQLPSKTNTVHFKDLFGHHYEMEKAEVTKLAQEEIANLVIKEFGMALEDGIKIKLLCQGMVIEDLKTIPDDACLHLLYLDSDFKPVNEEVNVFKNQYIAESKPNIG